MRYSAHLQITRQEHVVAARQVVARLARDMGMGRFTVTRFATAVSELARNQVVHAEGGMVEYGAAARSGREGIEVLFVDEGPGILDLDRAMAGGNSATGGLGLGLSGARRLVDDFDIHTEPGVGTRVRIWMYVR